MKNGSVNNRDINCDRVCPEPGQSLTGGRDGNRRANANADDPDWPDPTGRAP